MYRHHSVSKEKKADPLYGNRQSIRIPRVIQTSFLLNAHIIISAYQKGYISLLIGAKTQREIVSAQPSVCWSTHNALNTNWSTNDIFFVQDSTRYWILQRGHIQDKLMRPAFNLDAGHFLVVVSTLY